MAVVVCLQSDAAAGMRSLAHSSRSGRFHQSEHTENRVSISINTAIRQYLSSTCNQFNEDLVAWFLQHKPEWQGNIPKDIGEPMVRERPGKRPFKYRTHDGIDFWNIRCPHNAMDNPNGTMNPAVNSL